MTRKDFMSNYKLGTIGIAAHIDAGKPLIMPEIKHDHARYIVVGDGVDIDMLRQRIGTLDLGQVELVSFSKAQELKLLDNLTITGIRDEIKPLPKLEIPPMQAMHYVSLPRTRSQRRAAERDKNKKSKP
jgi:hypothetical protein